MYLLDTNVVSDSRRPRPNSGLVRWLEATEDRHLHLSAVMLAEIQVGIELTRDRDPAKAAEIEAWADLLAEAYSVLPVAAPIFRQWAKLMHFQITPQNLYPIAGFAAEQKNLARVRVIA